MILLGVLLEELEGNYVAMAGFPIYKVTKAKWTIIFIITDQCVQQDRENLFKLEYSYEQTEVSIQHIGKFWSQNIVHLNELQNDQWNFFDYIRIKKQYEHLMKKVEPLNNKNRHRNEWKYIVKFLPRLRLISEI